MRRAPVLWSAVVAASLFAPAAPVRAEAVTEPSSGHAFEANRTVDGKPFVLIGAGIRKKFIVKVYAMALYVDETDAKRAFPALANRVGGRDHAKLTSDSNAQSFVAYGDFGKFAVLHFVRTVDGGKIKEAFQEGLTDELSQTAAPQLRADAQAFVDLFDREVKDGQELWIKTGPDGQIEAWVTGTHKMGPKNPRLARAIWNIWIGSHPISDDLKKSLVDRIDVLGK